MNESCSPETNAAIVSVDLLGYSGLARQPGWLEQFSEYVAKLGEQISNQRVNTDVVKTAGDGFLLIYQEGKEGKKGIERALEHACCFQKHFNQTSSLSSSSVSSPLDGVPAFWIPRARIAVHWGPVRYFMDAFTQAIDAVGESIITACRLEPAVLPGMIWLTAQARDAALKESLQNKYYFRPIGTIPFTKGWDPAPAFQLVVRDPCMESANGTFGFSIVRQYQADEKVSRRVFLVVIPVDSRKPISVLLLWGRSHHHCVVEGNRPAIFEHVLLPGRKTLPLLSAHVSSPAWLHCVDSADLDCMVLSSPENTAKEIIRSVKEDKDLNWCPRVTQRLEDRFEFHVSGQSWRFHPLDW
jgi:class 3 adenylate cyclase